MKVSVLRTEQRIETPDFTTKNIRSYGKANDYPQRILDVCASSGTVNKCLSIYGRFVLGNGIPGVDQMMVNGNTRLIDLMRDIVKDNGKLGGRVYHLNYNMLGQVSNIAHVPLEFVRFEIGEDKELTGKFVYYDDWTRRKRVNFRDDGFITINPFSPENVLSEIETAGGIDSYNGQLLYISNNGSYTYPSPIIDSIISDVATEDGVATIKYRNVKNNFLPSGIVTTIGSKAENDEQDSNVSEMSKQLATWQTENSACKLIHVEVARPEDKPVFERFDVQNFDKEFQYTEESVQRNIGNIFMQPPVLRGELVSGKLGTASEIKDAHDFYNSMTSNDRMAIEDDLRLLFSYWHTTVNSDFKIQPLTYGNATNIE